MIKSRKRNIHSEIFQNVVLTHVEENIKFDPPVYRQRYGKIEDILFDNPWKNQIKKIVDFGAAECKLFPFVKRLPMVNNILMVDIDKIVLQENSFRIQPVTLDYISKRTAPLTVELLCGSISDPDYRLIEVDAVIGIEIIEHLYPNTLDALPFNVFGISKPKLVLLTTPNADFNVLFPKFKKFRHYDHKFEWSREQFQSWATNITTRFPEYTVSFQGIGNGPKGKEHFGCCSQMAIFTRNLNSVESTKNLMDTPKAIHYNCYSSFGVCTYLCYTNEYQKSYSDISHSSNEYYELILSVDYPYYIDERSLEEKILDELKYKISLLSNVNGRFFNDDRNRAEIPIPQLLINQDYHVTTDSEAEKILNKFGYKLEECMVHNVLENCLIVEFDMESRSSTPLSDSDNDLNKEHYSGLVETLTSAGSLDWDVDSDIQKNLWDFQQSEETEASHSANQIVNNLINNLQLPLVIEDCNFNSSKLKVIKQNSLSKDDEVCGESGSNDDLGCDKSNTYVKVSSQSSNVVGGAHLNKICVNDGKVSNQIIRMQLSTTMDNTNESSTNNLEERLLFLKKGKLPITKNTEIVSRSDLLVLPSNKTDANCIGFIPGTSDVMSNIGQNPDNHLINSSAWKGADSERKTETAKSKDVANSNIHLEINNNPNVTMTNQLPSDNEHTVLQDIHSIENIAINNDVNTDATVEDIIGIDQNVDIAQDILIQANELQLEFASREVLFDPNSQIDLLEDFDAIILQNISNPNELPHQNVVVLGVGPILENNDLAPVLPINVDPFPNWLLHILGAGVVENIENHDEPHFYCQGDGIGVHPSFIEEDFEDESSSSDGSDSSNRETTDEGEAEPSVSEVDVGSLPDDANDGNIEAHVNGVTQEVVNNDNLSEPSVVNSAGTSNGTESMDEFFDTHNAQSQDSSNRSEKNSHDNKSRK